MNPTRKTGFQPLRGDTAGALERAIKRFDKRLWYVARLLAEGNKALAQDLHEAAMVELWELDPSRFDLDDDGYLWQAMMKRMFQAHRNEQRRNPIRPPLALRIP